MMKSEFIERTGFEPTEAEYREIEAEYMGCDIDKDEFCKTWKKQGGIQRLMRLRARRIEELEAELEKRRMTTTEWMLSIAPRLMNLKSRFQMMDWLLIA